MIEVSLEFVALLPEVAGGEEPGTPPHSQRMAEGSTVRDLLGHLAASYPGFRRSVFDPRDRRLNEGVRVFVNSHDLELEKGLATLLQDGDTIVFVPVIQGG